MRLLLPLLLVVPLFLSAQGPKGNKMIGDTIRVCTEASPCGPNHVTIPEQEPKVADVTSIDGMIKAWYDIVTGPKGQPRPWGRDHTLYNSETRFLSVGRGPKGKLHATLYDHQGYVNAVDKGLTERGFYETEIHRVTQRFGNTVHVYSTYESREVANGPVTARGINSIELFHDGTRWWIMYAQWQEETPNQPIPKEYLP
jgi:hypothetical protein